MRSLLAPRGVRSGESLPWQGLRVPAPGAQHSPARLRRGGGRPGQGRPGRDGEASVSPSCVRSLENIPLLTYFCERYLCIFLLSSVFSKSSFSFRAEWRGRSRDFALMPAPPPTPPLPARSGSPQPQWMVGVARGAHSLLARTHGQGQACVVPGPHEVLARGQACAVMAPHGPLHYPGHLCAPSPPVSGGRWSVPPPYFCFFQNVFQLSRSGRGLFRRAYSAQ